MELGWKQILAGMGGDGSETRWRRVGMDVISVPVQAFIHPTVAVTRVRSSEETSRSTDWPALKVLDARKHVDAAGWILLDHILDIVRPQSFLELTSRYEELDLTYSANCTLVNLGQLRQTFAVFKVICIKYSVLSGLIHQLITLLLLITLILSLECCTPTHTNCQLLVSTFICYFIICYVEIAIWQPFYTNIWYDTIQLLNPVLRLAGKR